MKLKNLETAYLTGVIDTCIANYDAHCNSIPAEKSLVYSIRGVLTGSADEPVYAAKITFSWIVEKGERTNLLDNESEPEWSEDKTTDEYLTVLAGQEIALLQSHIEDILDKVIE